MCRALLSYFLRIPAEHQVQIGGSLRHERVQGPTGAPLDGQGDPKGRAREHGLPRYRQLNGNRKRFDYWSFFFFFSLSPDLTRPLRLRERTTARPNFFHREQ